jgi:dTDP-4-amino-4,6-dideoxygalactose transaminase
VVQDFIQAARPSIGDQERAAVDRVLLSGGLAQGAEVAAFETEFSEEVVGGVDCVAVNSGTSALHLALMALGIGGGDEVIVPSFTFAATANAVALTGARPVFVDIDERSFCMDPSAARAAVTSRTRAIMPVHLYGHPADMSALGRLAAEADLLVLEDAAQAHGATWRGSPVGTFGNAGAFSFYPTKNMTSGEGGMVTTSDAGVARKVRLLRNQGQEVRYHNEVVGLNNRMTDIHAAIGRVQLRALPAWTQARQRNAAFYDENLRGVVTPPVAYGAAHVYHQYTIRVVGADRDEFARQLADRGVGSGVYYPVPVHRLAPFADDALGRADLPVTEQAARECLSLPVYPSLTEGDLERVVTAVNAVAGAGS